MSTPNYFVWLETPNAWERAVDLILTRDEAEALATVLSAFRPDRLFVVSVHRPQTVSLKR